MTLSLIKYWMLVGLFGLLPVHGHTQHELAPLIDKFLTLSSENPAALHDICEHSMSIDVLYCNDEEHNTQLTLNQYIEDAQKVNLQYKTSYSTVVLIQRSFGDFAKVFCSVYSTFEPVDAGEVLVNRSVHSYQLYRANAEWKILHVAMSAGCDQNLPAYLWPPKITADYPILIPNDAALNRPFNADEVDEEPVYPGNEIAYQRLLGEHGVQEIADELHSPFTVIIGVDGIASLGYVGDLSGEQIERAKTFVSSMDAWYPALKDRASVRLKKIYYIQ